MKKTGLRNLLIIISEEDNMNNCVSELFAFIKKSPTAYNAVNESADRLEKMGCTRLEEGEIWEILPGKKYYVTRNGSSIIAFAVPEKGFGPFKIIASHCDSPLFKLKDNFEIKMGAAYTKLDTERYGGMIMSSWMDRPLSVAGRAVLDRDGKLEARVFDLERPVAVIPNMPIHFSRNINDGFSYNPQVDMLPITGGGDEAGGLKKLIYSALRAEEKDIISWDMYLYCAQEGCVAGTGGRYILSPRIDNLECAFSSLKAFETAGGGESIDMCCIFDNEEVGSGTKQGADSSFLSDVIERVGISLGVGGEDMKTAMASSFMVSADNAHALHPNHPEKYDELNRAVMNGGVVIKYNANQKYTSDGVSAAIFKKICAKCGVPVQSFSNRSDIIGGSTLGNISNSHVSINTVDIGLAQLAMHSAVETAGTEDIEYMIRAMRCVYSSEIVCRGDGRYEVI